ncbi:type I-C CRISPR-associated protein Cas5c [Magnetospira sp. QH-2]|uniref:type I-C CRISPR-associated protein Cas5c n=1 Tax=Magnetospira sp. (strain QH-2) TaxID=1288970 RepID=UPI0003E8159A|nr:type I-C CRISPR-associated protein Cas5c [Magnetospira sp. QH-2]CCQ74033.1 Cas_Cas5d: CRISPR-associated protein Cas5 [Magnetospira sp. QH-2]
MTDGTLSPPLRLKVWGDRACFSRPEMKVERVSYDVMTPSAARGVLEAILWKPQMRWVVERIDVLNPIRKDRVRRNEVSGVASYSNAKSAANGSGVSLGFDIENNRQQRAALILRDVAYVIHARLGLTPKAGPDDSLTKYVEMFRRRAAAGQCFHRPYLGNREFACEFDLLNDRAEIAPISKTESLGWMLHDIDFTGKEPTPTFFEARLDNGSLNIPAPGAAEVLR